MGWVPELFLPTASGWLITLVIYLPKYDREGAKRLTFGRAVALAAYGGATWTLGFALIDYLANEPLSWEIALEGG